MLTYKRVSLVTCREYIAVIIFEVIGEMKMYEEVNVKFTYFKV
jgi:hypothetical protein